MNGLFYENGPYVIQEDLTLRYSEYGWDQGANILFVEQPVGTGFSRSSDDADYARYEDAVGENMLMFFLKFMEIHPELREKDLFLSGESYAGKNPRFSCWWFSQGFYCASSCPSSFRVLVPSRALFTSNC